MGLLIGGALMVGVSSYDTIQMYGSKNVSVRNVAVVVLGQEGPVGGS